MEVVEKVFTSGKKVKVRELSALEEVLCYQMISTQVDEKNPFGAGVLHRTCMVALAVVSIDDEQVAMPQTINDVYAIVKQFKIKEWKSIEATYDLLNEADLGE